MVLLEIENETFESTVVAADNLRTGVHDTHALCSTAAIPPLE